MAPSAAPMGETPTQIVNQLTAARPALRPQSVLQLQRTLGNRAVTRQLKQPSLPARIQRASLDEIYGERVADNSEKKSYLADFKKIQALLKNEDKSHNILNGSLLQDGGWEQRLGTFESTTGFSAARPTLINFVPPQFFLKMVGRKQSFEDLLDASHGVHTHRIQWHLIAKDIELNGGYQHTVLELYQEAGNEFWENNKKYMWDEIVDREDSKQGFAFPEVFAGHLVKHENFRNYREEEEATEGPKKLLKTLWQEQGSKDDPPTKPFAQVKVGTYIFTGFKLSGEPSVVYKDTEADQIPTGD